MWFLTQEKIPIVIYGSYISNCNIIANADKMISDQIENIVYIFDCWQPLYDELTKIRDIKFVEGIPSVLNGVIIRLFRMFQKVPLI